MPELVPIILLLDMASDMNVHWSNYGREFRDEQSVTLLLQFTIKESIVTECSTQKIICNRMTLAPEKRT